MAQRAKIPTDPKKRGRPIKWTEDIILMHADKIIEWAYENPKEWRVGRYFRANKIPPTMHREFCRISEIYKEKAVISRGILLENLHWLIGNDTLNSYYGTRMLRIMDKDYNEECKNIAYEDEKAKEKAKRDVENEVGTDKTLKVVFEDRPSKKPVK